MKKLLYKQKKPAETGEAFEPMRDNCFRQFPANLGLYHITEKFND
jgi:hypothetical protein